MDDYLTTEAGKNLTTETGAPLIVNRHSPRAHLLAENRKRLVTQSGLRLLVERDLRVSAEFGEVVVELQDDGTLTVTWDGEFHNVAEFEVQHRTDGTRATWVTVGTVSGRERSLNFSADVLGETRVIALSASGGLLGSSAAAADDEQNEEPCPTYSMHDLGVQSAVGDPRGLNDSGLVLLNQQLWSFAGVENIPQLSWRQAQTGPLQDGTVWLVIPDDGWTDDANPPLGAYSAQSLLYCWRLGGAPVAQGVCGRSVDYLYSYAAWAWLLAVNGIPPNIQTAINQAKPGLSWQDQVLGHASAGVLNDRGEWSYGGGGRAELSQSTVGTAISATFNFAGVGGLYFFYGAAGAYYDEFIASQSGDYVGRLLRGNAGALAYEKALFLDWCKLEDFADLTDRELGPNSEYGVFLMNEAAVRQLPGAVKLHDLNSDAGNHGFALVSGNGSAKVWAFRGEILKSVELAGRIPDAVSVVGRKISNRMLVPLGDKIWQGNMQRWEKGQLTGRTWTTHEICGEPEDWENIQVTLVSPDNNLLVGTAMQTKDADGQPLDKPVMHSVLLIKAQLFDAGETTVGKQRDSLPDREIAMWDTAQVITEKSIAWIKAHTSAENPAPQMPKLELRLTSFAANVVLKVKLKVQYHRGNGERTGRDQFEDTVQIPADGGFKYVTGNIWKIWEDYEELAVPFFGGDAELTYQVMFNNGVNSQIKTVYFRIGGQNPEPAKCKDFIESQPNAGPNGNLWFAYAIAKHESKDYNGTGTRYNQFLVKPGSKERKNIGFPLWHNDGSGLPGGYGLFQVTGNVNDEKADIPRQQIWNWQENVKAGLALIAAKKSIAVTWMNRQKNANNANGTPLPNLTVNGVLFSENTSHTMTDAVAMKAYNGASKPPIGFVDKDGIVPGFILDPHGSNHYCFWKNNPGAWALSRFNSRKSNYVSLVCMEI